jgi:hypothetical protein
MNLPAKKYEFSAAFDAESTHEAVFAQIIPLILSFMDGYTSLLLAYGEPSSGKSTSLFGSQGNPGVIRRSLREMYRVAAQRKAEGESSYTFRVSVLLITSDSAIDLLADGRRRGVQSPDIRHDAKGSTLINTSSTEVLDESEAIATLNRSLQARVQLEASGSSGPSHLLIQMTATGVNLVTGVTWSASMVFVECSGQAKDDGVGRSGHLPLRSSEQFRGISTSQKGSRSVNFIPNSESHDGIPPSVVALAALSDVLVARYRYFSV